MSVTKNVLAVLQLHSAVVSDQAWRLQPGQVVSMDHTRGRRLACTAGRLWVTFEHDRDDFILEANQTLEIGENGRVVIGALGPGSFKVA